MSVRCICGCGQTAHNRHHVVYVQELRRLWKETVENYQRWLRPAETDGHPLADRYSSLSTLLNDSRNLVSVAFDCHMAHHGAARRFLLYRLPDSVFEFAEEILGAEKGYEYLKRRYDGSDMRHERMLLREAA